MHKSLKNLKKPINIGANKLHVEITEAAMENQFYLGQEEKMGSKKKNFIPWEKRLTNAYGATITNAEKQKIDNHNAANKTEGQTKDQNWQLERESIAQKAGTIQYKNISRKHMGQIGSILGVKSR